MMVQRTETFSYLPPMTRDQLAAQVAYALRNGWIPAVEYTRQPGPDIRLWDLWKLPFFDVASPEPVLQEADACHQAHPDAYVRIVAFDPAAQIQRLSVVAYRPGEVT